MVYKNARAKHGRNFDAVDQVWWGCKCGKAPCPVADDLYLYDWLVKKKLELAKKHDEVLRKYAEDAGKLYSEIAVVSERLWTADQEGQVRGI